MQFEVLAVPAAGDRELVDALNRFLRSHRVLHVDRRLVEKGTEYFWTFCVEYIDSPVSGVGGGPGGVVPKVDYKAILTPEQFARFSVLRQLRKELADKEAIPPYAVFTNEQLAEMVKLATPTKEDIQAIPGIGQAKMQKYGDAFLKLLIKPGQEAVAARAEKSAVAGSGPAK